MISTIDGSPCCSSPTTSPDFFTSSNIGLVPGVERVGISGRNPNVGTGAIEDIWSPGGLYPFLQVAETLRIAPGGNASDTAAGTGAGPFIGPADMWFSAVATGGGGTSVTCEGDFYIEEI